jgi:hypothetical protein
MLATETLSVEECRAMSRLLRLGVIATFALVVGSSSIASAQTFNVKVGLWEVTTKGQMGGPPPVDTSKMPPERRGQAEAMIKAMLANAAKPRTFKSCITKEKLEKDPFEEREEGQRCKRSYLTRTATVLAFKEECTGSDGNTVTEGRFEATSSEAVKGTLKVVLERAGMPINFNSDLTGKYIGAACGDVK